MAPDLKSARDATSVRVELGERSYDILIGREALQGVGKAIADLLPGARTAVVTDRTVAALHLETVRQSLGAADIDHVEIVVEPGEGSKSFDELTEIVDVVLGARLERGDAILALGGGVVGDLAGFAAAIVRRGMHTIQLPTTLLAQVDSSVGGKTGINTAHGKNLIGAFHQPAMVVADTAVLDTLPPRTFNAGYAEVAKIALINDADFFSWLESNWRAIVAGWPERDEAVATACRAKAAIVAEDETEQAHRALLNLGHTFGHALETATGYSDRLLHGEAVAIGIALAFQFSNELGLAPPADTERVLQHFKSIGLPTTLGDIPGETPGRDALMANIAQDKKVRRGQLTFILTRGIGAAFVERDVPADRVAAFLDTTLDASK